MAYKTVNTLEVLLRVIGTEETRRLLSALGGRKISIPKDPDHAHNLSGHISQESVRRICMVMGPAFVYLPKVDKLDALERNVEIVRILANGASVCDAARRFGLTTRQVRRIKKSKSGHVLQMFF